MFFSDRLELETRSRGKATSHYLGNGVVLSRLLGKYPILLSGSDRSITPCIVLDGFWESWVTLAMLRHLKPGMRCVDVGANIGYFALLMAHAVGEDGMVRAFEPQEDLARLLKQTAQLNGVQARMDVHTVALTDRSRLVRLVPGGVTGEKADPAYTGSSRILTADEERDAINCFGGSGCPVSVHAQAFDGLFLNEIIDFVKMDVEGHEMFAFNGMREAWDRSPNPVALVEWGPQFNPEHPYALPCYFSMFARVQMVDTSGDVVDLPWQEWQAEGRPLNELYMLWVTKP